MGNCSATEIWTPNISTPYVVRLERHSKCCGEHTMNLFINGRKKENFSMIPNRYSPLVSDGGTFVWEEHGHQFLLQYNSLSFDKRNPHRLFVDHIDVNTGLGYASYYRRQGYIYCIVGLLFALITAGGITAVALNGLAFLWLPLNFGTWGCIFLIMGILSIVKFKGKTDIENSEKSPLLWPEAYRSSTNQDVKLV